MPCKALKPRTLLYFFLGSEVCSPRIYINLILQKPAKFKVFCPVWFLSLVAHGSIPQKPVPIIEAPTYYPFRLGSLYLCKTGYQRKKYLLFYGLCKGLLSKLVRTAGRVVTRCSNCSLCGILTTIHEKTQHFDSYTRSSSCLCKQLADLSCKHHADQRTTCYTPKPSEA